MMQAVALWHPLTRSRFVRGLGVAKLILDIIERNGKLRWVIVRRASPCS